ncbi:MAG: adenosylhomocysteinase [Clostridiales bacterium]|nr:adenosylhomocysteinase [Clostridiales bacterium]
MSSVLDITLAPFGRKKIEWVKSYMPVLEIIGSDFCKKKPFEGLKVAMSIHLEAKTAYLAEILRDGGAEVYITGCNPLSTQDDVAAALAAEGLNVFARHGVGEDEYKEHLKAVLDCSPHLLIDDGGDLVQLLHGECANKTSNLIGGCEETTTGVHRLFARMRAGLLHFPMVDVNNADCKYLFDNRYGTGQSTIDGIMNTTNLMIAGKTVVIAGYGWCGRGLAMRMKGMGALVIVTEIDPVKAIEAAMDGFRVMKMDDAAPLGDFFVTLTGCCDVIVGRHFDMMKDGAVLANSGHFDVEINKRELEARSVKIFDRRNNIRGYRQKDGRTLNLLADGRLVNLAAANGHPAEIMDMSFALQAKSLEWLVQNKGRLENRIYPVPAEIDRYVAELKLKAIGCSIDSLTVQQKEYLEKVD